MPGRLVTAVVTLVGLAFVVTTATAQDEPSRPRLWVMGGPSWDRTTTRTNTANGYAFSGGVDIGRAVALTMGLGFEHYPTAKPPESSVIGTPSGPDTARVEGGGNKKVTSLSAGVRFAMSGKRLEPIAEAALGYSYVSRETRRYVDPETGAVVFPSQRLDWSGVMGELGLGVRTRSGKGVDGKMEVRWRGATSGPEGSSTSSIQLLFGVITR